MAGLVKLGWLLFAAFFAVSLVKPIWPCRSRVQVVLLGIAGGFIGLVLLGATADPPAIAENASNTEPVAQKSRQTEQLPVSTEKIKPALPGEWWGKVSWWGWPDDVIRANDALTIHYLRTGRYSPVDCRNRQVQGLMYIRCRSTGSSVIGAIYIVTNSVGPLAILPANGKARGQTGDREAFVDVENKPIRVIQKSHEAYLKILTNQPLDTAIDEFQKDP